MMTSDSSQYETTYSEDEAIEFYLQKKKKEALLEEKLLDTNRKEHFKEIFENSEEEIFHLPGLVFKTYTHLKIKFIFTPKEVVKHVSTKLHFFCTLKYYRNYKYWNITKRNSIPVNYKWKIYNLFYDGPHFGVTDENVNNTILKIYELLKIWSHKEEKFRISKRKKFLRNGDDLAIDTDDEEIFMDNDSIEILHRKRNKIWFRMLPPEKKKTFFL